MADTKTPLWQKITLVGCGTLAAVAVVILVLVLFPNLLPGSDFNAREYAGETLEVEFRYTDGDLFSYPGRVRPPEEDVVLERYTIAWDEYGFRVPAQTADTYPIAAIGDSFTEGANVPRPWPDVVADLLQTPVRNYGYRNYGPYEMLDTVQDFVVQEAREWVLYGYFSGNDLADLLRTESQRVTERTPGYILPWIVERAADNISRQIDPDADYTYPMPVIIGGNYYDMAFHENLIWWQLAPEAGFEASRSWEIIDGIYDEINNTLAPETCVALIFIPTKGQLYWPYIHPNARRYLLDVAYRPEPNDDGLLWLEEAPLPRDAASTLPERLDAQRDAVRQLAQAKGWLFIDLLEPFRQRVAEGDLLYYRYDGHWNQAGHDFAAEIIAEAIQNAECEAA